MGFGCSAPLFREVVWAASGLLFQVHLITELQRVCLSCPPPHTTPHPQNQMNLHIWLQSRLGWFTSAGVLIIPTHPPTQNKLIGFCTPLLVKQFSGCAYHAPPPPHPPPPEPDEFAHLGIELQRARLSPPPPTPPPPPQNH